MMFQGRYNLQLIKTFATLRVNSSKLKPNEQRPTDAKPNKPKLENVLKKEKEDHRSNHMKSQTHIIDQIQAQKAKIFQNGMNFKPPAEDFISRIQERYIPKCGVNVSEVMTVTQGKRSKKRKTVEVKKTKNKKLKLRRELPPFRFFTTKSQYWAQDPTPRSYIVY